MKKRRYILLLIAALAGCLFLFQKPVRISYNRFMKDYCDRKVLSFPPLDDNKSKYFVKSDIHLKALVRLGYFEMKVFELENIKKGSLDAKRLEHILINLHLGENHIIAFPLRDPEVDFFNVVIYAPPKYMLQYERIIHVFDLTDFRGD